MSEPSERVVEAIRRVVERRRRERFAEWGWSPQQIAASELLAQRYTQEREQLGTTGQFEQLSCVAKLDRVICTTNDMPAGCLNEIPGFQFGRRRRLWGAKQLYQYAQPIRSTGSDRDIVVEFEPKTGWAPKFRITIIPHDVSGLQRDDLELVLGLLPGFKLVLVELAFDFPIGSVIDVDFVRRFGLFGKNWLPPGVYALYDKWGGAPKPKGRSFVSEIRDFFA